ncbi:MAG: hypothetical protein M1817_001513 [Caeruleum heppii]|nr:MAG: hypothetical protein M1817_001513 [Caeruleum heppii]
MAADSTSPPVSRSSTPAGSTGRKSPLSLDLSNIPSLIQPAPPSNTLLITNLLNPSTFNPDTLAQIRTLIESTTQSPCHSFAPLKSLRRIIVSFFTSSEAVQIRQLLDGETIMGSRVRCFFGEPTPIEDVSERERHLKAPDAGKLFFISPPPSPPCGWESRHEDPPNREVMAGDLAEALGKLRAGKPPGDINGPISPDVSPIDGARDGNRQRSSSMTMIYHPGDSGDSPLLPAIAVEDTTGESWSPIASDGQMELPDVPMGGSGGKEMLHTARPPVELLQNS